MGVGFTPGTRSEACRPNTQAIGLLPEERHPIGYLWPCLRRQSMASSPTIWRSLQSLQYESSTLEWKNNVATQNLLPKMTRVLESFAKTMERLDLIENVSSSAAG